METTQAPERIYAITSGVNASHWIHTLWGPPGADSDPPGAWYVRADLVEGLVKALEAFAREADEWHESVGDNEAPFIGDYNPHGALLPARFTVGDLRAARNARAALRAAEAGATREEG